MTLACSIDFSGRFSADFETSSFAGDFASFKLRFDACLSSFLSVKLSKLFVLLRDFVVKGIEFSRVELSLE